MVVGTLTLTALPHDVHGDFDLYMAKKYKWTQVLAVLLILFSFMPAFQDKVRAA